MHPHFGCSDSDSPRPSVRAALDVSLELLDRGECRDAFTALGVLPVRVRLHMLTRLWWFSLGGVSAGGRRSAAQSSCEMQSTGVEELVNALVRAWLVRRDVDEVSAELVGVVVHPVVGQYALSLLGDSVRSIHPRVVADYVGDLFTGSLDEHGWRRLPFWEVPDDGYWYDHVVRHVAGAENVCGLVSGMDPAWQAVRVGVSSALACQADVEGVLTALKAVVDGAAAKGAR